MTKNVYNLDLAYRALRESTTLFQSERATDEIVVAAPQLYVRFCILCKEAGIPLREGTNQKDMQGFLDSLVNQGKAKRVFLSQSDGRKLTPLYSAI